MKPIRLTEQGDVLMDHLPDLKRGDETVLSGEVGLHSFCRGSIKILRISPTHKALICSFCYLRVAVPAEVETYGDLRNHFS